MMSLTRIVQSKPVAHIEPRHGQSCVVLDSIVLFSSPSVFECEQFLSAQLPVAHFANFPRVIECAVIWLLEDRLSDTTLYDPIDYRRIRAQRTRAKKGLMEAVATGSMLHWQAGTGAFTVRLRDGSFHYSHSGAENEEITNMLRRIVDPSAQWVA